MPRGSRPGERRGGRQKGTPNKATTKRLEEMKAKGELPLDYMLRVMRDKDAEQGRRDAMAIAAARYCHSALAAVEAKHSGNIVLTHEQALGELE